MTFTLILGVLIAAFCLAAMLAGASILNDRRDASHVRQRLTATARRDGARFDPGIVADLPEPVRRYFLFSIAPGAPLKTVAEIFMEGELALGSKLRPDYFRMHASQILAPPHGLLWSVSARRGGVNITGSDAMCELVSWTRFRLWALAPVVRARGSDHLRSSFGRVIAEGLIWIPAAFLPGEGVAWEAPDDNTARVTVTYRGMKQSVDIAISADGRPTKVSMMRWSNANPAGLFQEQPFGGVLSDFKTFAGYMLATRVDGGNFIGTPDYFPFYRATVSKLRWV